MLLRLDGNRCALLDGFLSSLCLRHAPPAASSRVANEILHAAGMLSVRQASHDALTATFCLCPTGDSKGHTARLFHAIVHGCIPIRVDGWERGCDAF